ncbi:hypothetical protein T265_05747 [Opisthorchis viverrini]|uniref:Uncharacterized protein n=1 Tax=Opisthorchis viverrini TaxID=6198 RepID=A0A074ZJG2_OPIVI|nr:hypothetical protein T265_05747 [Opisthorchis viverrini]KER27126.1 hypothetical protein T265_05747 [Opisthorchis viverrini]
MKAPMDAPQSNGPVSAFTHNGSNTFFAESMLAFRLSSTNELNQLWGHVVPKNIRMDDSETSNHKYAICGN